MSKPKIILSETYQKRLSEIEDFIWESSGKNILAMEAFLTSHDNALEFLKENPMDCGRLIGVDVAKA